MYQVDSYFEIGSSHETQGIPCQDYAVTATNDTDYFAMIADGCSSGRNTDLGARILCHYLLEQFNNQTLSAFLAQTKFDSVLWDAVWAKRVTQDINDYLATMLFAFSKDGSHYIYSLGDGVFSYIQDRTLVIVNIEYNLNTPYYLAYKHNGLNKAYERHFEKEEWIKKTTSITYDLDNESIVDITTVNATKENYDKFQVFKLDNISQLTLFSDGIMQTNLYDVEKTVELIHKLNQFKTTAGTFVKRTCINGMKKISKDLQSENPFEMYPDKVAFIDDFSMASIIIT